jgi:uncharacterized protein YndB with AHSA1/START domain
MITKDSVVSDEVEIAAPVERVWEILIDFENYDSWNSFCPSIRNRALEVDEAVEMMTDLGNGLQKQIEFIRSIVPNQEISWGMANAPRDAIHALRTQRLTRVDEHSCRYVSDDVFSGVAVEPMLAAFGKPIEDGFNRCARELKRHAEKQYSRSS